MPRDMLAGHIPAPSSISTARVSPSPVAQRFAGAWFDTSTADVASHFFPTYLRFTGGPFAGRTFDLQSWQDWIVRTAYGWRRADGTRLYRRIILWVPRKNGKTELLAGVAHLSLLAFAAPGHGGEGGECYSIAANKDQARIVFRAAQQMAAYSPDLNRHYESRKTSLYCPALNAVMLPLTGKPTGKHGLRCSVLLGDEAHEWPNFDLYDFVRQSMGMWPEPIEWIISTAGIINTPGQELWEECLKIVEGTIDAPDTLVVMFGADDGDDIQDPAVWQRANPNLGVSLDRTWFAGEAKKASQLWRYEANFRRYHLNIWTAADTKWIPAEVWSACAGAPADDTEAWRRYADELAGRPCFGGFDGASTKDINALGWLFPPAGPDPKWRILPRFWWPRMSAEAQMRGSRIPFDAWAQRGAITLTDGNVADHDAIAEQIIEDCARFQVQKLGADPFNTHQLLIDLANAGVPVVQVRQGMKTLSAPSKEFERLVLGQDLAHGHHPVLRWMVSNCSIKTDDQDNIMPAKKKSTGKIDGVAATVTALAVAQAEPEKPKTYLATEGLMIL